MTHLTLYIAVSILALAISGCGAPAETDAPSAPQPADHDAHDAHSDHEHTDHGDHDSNGMTAMEKMKAELAKLSPADAASAEKQHFCPVSGEMLGTMGAPIKVDVNGQQVWICCEGCREALLANPDEYMANLKS
mgnify:CR=1 FL=1